jgi:uncharacterized membrane protein
VRRSSWRLDRDLDLVAALIAAGLLVTALPLPNPVRAVVFIPLVLVAPGYALAAALFPPGFVTREERATLTFALSVAAWALGGVVLYLVIDLDLWAWLLMGATVTLASLVIAQWRRHAQPAGRRESAFTTRPGLGELVSCAVTASPAILALTVAVAVAVLALALASASQYRELARAHFSSVWISPPPSTSRPPTRISVGVENHEGTTGAFRLVVTTKGRTIDEWESELESGERFEASVPAAEAEGAVVAAVYRDGALDRRAKLEYGALK